MSHNIDSGVVSAVEEPIHATVPVGQGTGIELLIIGNYADMVELRRGGEVIYRHELRDGQVMPGKVNSQRVGNQTSALVNSDWNVAIIHGREQDIVRCYAIRGRKVFASGEYRKRRSGDLTTIHWFAENALKVSDGGYVEWKDGKWVNRR